MLLRLFVVLFLAAIMSVEAHAQAFPSKSMRLILPFPPGGPTDLLGRALAQKLGEQMGQTMVADNWPGAGGNLGIELAAKAPPDGHNIVRVSSVIAIAPSPYAKLNYALECADA
jgi:tripartite-type tricarboxylate transporter receptor subunit TctC